MKIDRDKKSKFAGKKGQEKRNTRGPKTPAKKIIVKKSKPEIFIVKEDMELMTFLEKKFAGMSRASLKKLLKFQQIEVDGATMAQFNYQLKVGQTVKFEKKQKPKENVLTRLNRIKILFEDDSVIVIEKEAGLLVNATDKDKKNNAFSFLSTYVKEKDSKNVVFVVNSLAKETSGILIFAKSQQVKKSLQLSWKDNLKNNTYIALVQGVVEEDTFVTTSYLKESSVHIVYSSDNPENGRKATTNFTVLKRSKGFTLLEVTPETGIKNQIRVQLNEAGFPVIGDKKYGSTVNPLRRLGLHAKTITFIHPSTKDKMTFDTEIPEVFTKMFKQT
ncbi:MAG: hypothetical protein B6226_04440 [Candidatus Cloacimonetes bacterium 4572_65]|nr:MAG: hypothetical protein B6226_04440 [Candidatus Cloacimonetes bacterium 4572_65]